MVRIITSFAFGVALAASGVAPLVARQEPAAGAAFDRLKSLEGDWVDVDGVFGAKGAVAATYRVTGGGTALVETFPVGAKQEMVTVYHTDGNDIVLTHYCAGGTQPRMRAKTVTGNVFAFDFDGGTNITPASTSHMHTARLELVSANELKATWHNWSNGKPDEQPATFRIVRKTP